MPKDVGERLYQQKIDGQPERYGKVRVSGKFEYGERYGHLGTHSCQITPSKVELLPWKPNQ